MPEHLRKIVLWRNTIQLFHKYNRPQFEGPFKSVGYKYTVEPYMLTNESGEERTPDIICSNESGWLVLELTTNTASKDAQLNSYTNMDPRNLSIYGLTTHEKTIPPDLMSSRLMYVDDGNHCQILVKNKFQVLKENYIKNNLLKNALIKAKDLDLTKLPEIPITLLPEMKSYEIRQGLIDIVMQLFEPESNGKTLIEIVDDGLERLSDKIRLVEKHALREKVKTELNVLIKDFLPEYLEFTENSYKASEKWKQHPKTMASIAKKLIDWSGTEGTLDPWL